MLDIKHARLMATFVLPGITFFFCILSMAFPSRQRCPLLMTVLLCFGAGVLLSTSMLHMLTEAHDDLPDLAELSFCIGFLLLYLIDEVVHFCACRPSFPEAQCRASGFNYSASILPSTLGSRVEKQQVTLYDQNSFDSNSSSDSGSTVIQYGNRLNSKHPRRFSGGNMSHESQDGGREIVSSYSKLLYETDKPSTSYGSTSTTERNIVNVEMGTGSSHQNYEVQQTSNSADRPASLSHRDLTSASTCDSLQISQRSRDTAVLSHHYRSQQERNEYSNSDMLCHNYYSAPCSKSRVGQIGLFVALTFHGTFEAMAVGLEPSAERVMLLTGAMTCHKLIVAFFYGLELKSCGNGCLRVCGQIFIFSLGSLLGVIIGGLLADAGHVHRITGPAVPIIQAISAGNLLYVTVCEVLPRERAIWHHQVEKRVAGILQFTSVAVGFCVMYAVNTYIGLE